MDRPNFICSTTDGHLGCFCLVATVNNAAVNTGMKMRPRDFPGGPVVGTSPSNAGGAGSISDRGAKIPHASRPEDQNVKQKQYCSKLNKDFKNGPHQKKKKKRKENETLLSTVWTYVPRSEIARSCGNSILISGRKIIVF